MVPARSLPPPRHASASITACAPALLVLATALLAGCATPGRSPLAEWTPSPNHGVRRAQLVVLHQTEMSSADAALKRLRDARGTARVSSHYLIGADGRIFQLVLDHHRAWHAGASRWGGRADLNSASIGIELDNDGRAPFADAQVDALLRLLADVTTRLRIPRDQIVGHSDVAPTRKTDPGAHFPWERLAAAGYGLWPRAGRGAAPEGFDPWVALGLIGYDVREPAAAARAYRRRFRGEDSGTFDPEDLAILHDLQQQLLSGR
jgi:N-acetylmuramoyl-L-alanine amidase